MQQKESLNSFKKSQKKSFIFKTIINISDYKRGILKACLKKITRISYLLILYNLRFHFI